MDNVCSCHQFWFKILARYFYTSTEVMAGTKFDGTTTLTNDTEKRFKAKSKTAVEIHPVFENTKEAVKEYSTSFVF